MKQTLVFCLLFFLVLSFMTAQEDTLDIIPDNILDSVPENEFTETPPEPEDTGEETVALSIVQSIEEHHLNYHERFR